MNGWNRNFSVSGFDVDQNTVVGFFQQIKAAYFFLNYLDKPMFGLP